ncbi:hypothetical protein WJX84_002134 [Apatococcus fuscideae]|uniref:Uncharacterized protein n=1 Tax=Apatococcus fuscideae TaxID=2026836 RepID=A0AAW1RI44_9CHLO
MLALGVSYFANVLATVALFTEFGVKLGYLGNNWPGPSHSAALANTVIGSACLLELLWIAVIWARRLLASYRLGKCWKHRRRRISLLVEMELLVQIINLVSFLIPNAAVLHTPCQAANRWIITICVGVRWTCWNTLFGLICIHAPHVNPHGAPPAGTVSQEATREATVHSAAIPRYRDSR